MLTRARDHSLRSNGSVGSGFEAGLSRVSNTGGPTSLALAEGPVIQLGEQLANGLVQIFQHEKLAMAQRRHDPALGDLHGVFNFGFVVRRSKPAWSRE